MTMPRQSRERSLSYDNETFVGDMSTRGPPPKEQKFATIDRSAIKAARHPRSGQKSHRNDQDVSECHNSGQRHGTNTTNGQDPGHHRKFVESLGYFEPRGSFKLGHYDPKGNVKPGPHPNYNLRVGSLPRSSGTSSAIVNKQGFAEALSKQKLQREEEQRKEDNRRWLSVWRSKSILIVSYFFGTVCFILFFHLQSLPKLPFPVGRNLADWDDTLMPYIWWPKGTVLIELMWGFTHIRKTFLIVAAAATLKQGSTHKHLQQSHDTRSGQQVSLGLLVLAYHVVIGAWLGWANNTFSGYYLTDMQYVLIGVGLYLIGEITVTFGTIYFIRRRTQESEMFRRFRLGSDFFIWTGFAFVSWTLPALIVFFLRFLLLVYFLCVPHRPACCCS